jgi:predicted dehydrogenase
MDVGVCGLGGFSSKIIKRIELNNNMTIIYGYHPDIHKAKAWNFDKGTDRYEDLLLCNSIKAVFVLTPNHLHTNYLISALNSKKHVFVEKPLAHILEEARDIVKKQKEVNKKILVGHNFRRQPWYREINKILNENKIGTVINVTVNCSHGGIFNFDKNNWRMKKYSHPEGPLSTIGIHYFDLIHYWFGKISYVDSIISNISGQSEAPDTNLTIMELESGVTVTMQTNYSQCSEDQLTIFGTEGTVYYNRGELMLRVGRDINRIPTKPKIINVTEDNSLQEEVDEFYNSIDNDVNIETSSIEGLNAVIVLDACFHSNKENRRMFLKEYNDYFLYNMGECN